LSTSSEESCPATAAERARLKSEEEATHDTDKAHLGKRDRSTSQERGKKEDTVAPSETSSVPSTPKKPANRKRKLINKSDQDSSQGKSPGMEHEMNGLLFMDSIVATPIKDEKPTKKSRTRAPDTPKSGRNNKGSVADTQTETGCDEGTDTRPAKAGEKNKAKEHDETPTRKRRRDTTVKEEKTDDTFEDGDAKSTANTDDTNKEGEEDKKKRRKSKPKTPAKSGRNKGK
jgi:hypothetical protein